MRAWEKFFLLFFCCALSPFAWANELSKKTCSKPKCHHWHLPTLPPSWKGSNAQLGAVVTTGNSNTTNLSGGLNLAYKKGPWQNNFQANLQFASSNGSTTQQQYFAQNQLNYNWGCNFIFGNINYTQDQFSPYDYQIVTSAGYGRTLVKTDKVNLSVQAGPGLRTNSIKIAQQPSQVNNHLIGVAGLNFAWQITDSVNFTENVTYNFGQPYDYLKTVSALTNKIIDNLAVQISYTTEYYSQIPLGSSNTQNLDTYLNLSLVYNLGS